MHVHIGSYSNGASVRSIYTLYRFSYNVVLSSAAIRDL